MSAQRLIGAVLAGGRSARMGRDKSALRLPDGRTMRQAVADALNTQCDDVVIVGGEAVLDCIVVQDQRPGAGPLAGIEALLASGFAPQYIVCPCDMPLLDAEVVAALATPSEAQATVIRRADASSLDPLPMRIAAGALDAVRALLDRDKRAVHGLLKQISVHVLDAPRAWSRALTNINSPEDLAAAFEPTT